jgi:hypothetical protein
VVEEEEKEKEKKEVDEEVEGSCSFNHEFFAD